MFIGKRAFLRSTRSNMIGTPTVSGAAEAAAWQAAVIANGGTVSAGRLAIVSSFIAAEKSAGGWALTDDYWGLWGENAPQALTSVKQRRLAVATAAPTFTANRDYAFNGTTQYLNTGFIPSTHALAMTGGNLRIAIYERVDASAGTYTAGVQSVSTPLSLSGRNGAGAAGGIGAGVVVLTLPAATSLGYLAMSRAGGTTTVNGCKNGTALTPVTATAPSVTLPTVSLYIGARNQDGVANTFRICSVGLVSAGAPLSAAQETAQYTNVQAWATAVGAQV